MLANRRLFPFAFLSAVILAGAWWAYYPGLSGGFLFDDFANLPALGATGAVDDWATFWRYITSGEAGPTGRPVALLSFLIDARHWPADPRPFLRTSVILHLINGGLLFLLLLRLGRELVGIHNVVSLNNTSAGATATTAAMPGKVTLAALLGAALWLLHPLLVSTTLYIVQREAMLPATFVLLGLLAWLRGRDNLLRGHTVPGLAWLILGLGVCTALATLSKANGILLPALALVIEYTLLRSRQATMPTPAYRRALVVLGWLPALLVLVYLLYTGWSGMTQGVAAHRPWTLGQRLLTEPRVLLDYLQLLWLPRPFTPGLFNDQIQASTSLFEPWTTLPCLLAVLGLIAGACLLRKRWPAAALAILFYFVGQALESSTVALELYFEHRNYLPALLMFWPLALWPCGVTHGNRRSSRGFAWAKGTLAVLAVLGLAWMTHARTSVWGNPHDQALLWARLNPQSPRAQAYAAQVEMAAGHLRQAIARLKPMVAAYPAEVQLALNLFGAECQAGYVTPEALAASRLALRTTSNPGSLLLHWFGRLIDSADHPACPQAGLATAEQLLNAALANSRLMAIDGRQQDLYHLKGRVALARNDADSALAWFNRALEVEPRPDAALRQAALLGAAGYPARGLAHLERFSNLRGKVAPPSLGMALVHAWVLELQGYWRHELAYLRTTLRGNVAGASGIPSAAAHIPTHSIRG